MDLLMTGFSHKEAELAVREKFALTKEKTGRALACIRERTKADGCVILSTCNRIEVYADLPVGEKISLPQILCDVLEIDHILYKPLFSDRNGVAAVRHLCHVAAGLDSQIPGDDQIITQVREALELSRALGFADSYLEKMFNLAIKAAKDIKTRVVIRAPGESSLSWEAVKKLKELRDLDGAKVLVIGNGQMGRLAAELLAGEGAEVTMTLRRYKKGAAQIPKGVATVGYDERYIAAQAADAVVSATSSPHFTLLLDDFSRMPKYPPVLLDLAVPRDIEPGIGNLPGVACYSIEDLSENNEEIPVAKRAEMEKIVDRYIIKFEKWMEYKVAEEKEEKRVFFPLFIDLKAKPVLVVGGGRIAERRIRTLVRFGADIAVVSPEITDELGRLSAAGAIRFIRKEYDGCDADRFKPFLIIAATDRRDVNLAVKNDAERMGVLAIISDAREACSCYFPAVAENGKYIAGLVSKDGSHAGVREMAERIRELFDEP